jgi:hypothetical protein
LSSPPSAVYNGPYPRKLLRISPAARKHIFTFWSILLNSFDNSNPFILGIITPIITGSYSPFLKLCNAEKGLLRQSTLKQLLVNDDASLSWMQN